MRGLRCLALVAAVACGDDITGVEPLSPSSPEVRGEFVAYDIRCPGVDGPVDIVPFSGEELLDSIR